jgi:hypothetical protein
MSAWTAPDWLPPYLPFLSSTGGNDVEELVNREVNMRVNLPLFLIQEAVGAQLRLLTTLHNAGLLLPPKES